MNKTNLLIFFSTLTTLKSVIIFFNKFNSKLNLKGKKVFEAVA